MRSCSARFRHGTDNICVHMRLLSQLTATVHSYRINHLTLKYGVRAGEVDVLEDTKSRQLRLRQLDNINGAYTISGQLHDLSGQHFADVSSADREESATLTGNHPSLSYLLVNIAWKGKGECQYGE